MRYSPIMFKIYNVLSSAKTPLSVAEIRRQISSSSSKAYIKNTIENMMEVPGITIYVVSEHYQMNSVLKGNPFTISTVPDLVTKILTGRNDYPTILDIVFMINDADIQIKQVKCAIKTLQSKPKTTVKRKKMKNGSFGYSIVKREKQTKKRIINDADRAIDVNAIFSGRYVVGSCK